MHQIKKLQNNKNTYMAGQPPRPWSDQDSMNPGRAWVDHHA
jgi:hypothetical protein